MASDLVTVIIDGEEVKVKKGTPVLEAAEQAGIYIPHLCYLHGLPAFVGCRTCVVEVEGSRDVEVSCSEPVRDGMVIWTNSPKVQSMRREVMEIMISEHPWKCLTCWRRERCDPFDPCQRDAVVDDRCAWCAKNKDCELQKVCDIVEMTYDEPPFFQPPKTLPLRWDNPFIEFDPNKCIYCTRCVRACAEGRAIGALELTYRGDHAIITGYDASGGVDLDCEFCGDCAAVCPCAAIMDRSRKYQGTPARSVESTCSFCGVGCGVLLDVNNSQTDGREQVYAVAAMPNSPVSEGELCVRGRYGYDYVHSANRLLNPKLAQENALLGRTFRTANWSEAIDQAAQQLAAIKQEFGPQAIGVIGSPKSTNEDAYALQKLARVVLGTGNVDQVAGIFHRPSVEGLMESLGVPASTTSLSELGAAQTIFVVGNNTTDTHPVVGLKIKNAVRMKGARLVVAYPVDTTDINPETTLSDLNRFATVWLRYRPGTEGVLLNAIAASIVERNLVGIGDRAAAINGFAEWRKAATRLALKQAEQITGVSVSDIELAAEIITGADLPVPEGQAATPARTIFVYGTGISYRESSPELVRGVANLAVLTGNVGAAGSGILALTAENNLQGATDMGVTPQYLPGYASLADADARQRFAEAWGGDVPAMGMDVVQMLEAAQRGELKALVIMDDDVLLSAPDPAAVRRALESVKLLVVIDALEGETAKLADVLLPGLTAVEREGSYTNLDRRVQIVRQAIDPIGAGKPQYQVIGALANRILELEGRAVAGFDWASAEAVLDEIGAVVAPYRGIIWSRLEAISIPWPVESMAAAGAAVLFPDGAPDARLLPIDREVPSTTTPEFPLQLFVTRSIYTDVSGQGAASRRLSKALDQEFVVISRAEADGLGVASGDVVRLVSPNGAIEATVRPSDKVPAGVVIAPYTQRGGVNRLEELDGAKPTRGLTPVRIEKVG